MVIERDAQTGLHVGYVPGWPGAHSQGETVAELKENLAEVISMLLEDGEPSLESEFVGTQTVQVG
jgi:predicted RNase H-like HicB family nuclease